MCLTAPLIHYDPPIDGVDGLRNERIEPYSVLTLKRRDVGRPECASARPFTCCQNAHGNNADTAAAGPQLGLARYRAASAQTAWLRRNRGGRRPRSGAGRRSNARSLAAQALFLARARRAAPCGAVSLARRDSAPDPFRGVPICLPGRLAGARRARA